MLVVTAAFFITAKLRKSPKADFIILVEKTLMYAFIGAMVSLAFTIAGMVWYEKTTGFSAGNGPLGWIFIYGPPSAALGQLVALLHWWFMKPTSVSKSGTVA